MKVNKVPSNSFDIVITLDNLEANHLYNYLSKNGGPKGWLTIPDIVEQLKDLLR